jgi:outer membrane lipoprotein-sorting protein
VNIFLTAFFALLLYPATLEFGAGVQDTKTRPLDTVLARMEAVGKNFRSFQANFTQRKYIAILEEYDNPESGVFMYARAKDGSAMLRQEVVKPGPRILTIKGGVATVYQPVIKQASIANLGKNKDKAEFLALGIGQSPARMRETFEISYGGTDSIDGVSCSLLELSPKSTATAAFFTSFTLWISDVTNLPIQQKLQEPGGDYLLVRFSSEKLNPRLADSLFEQNLPKDVEIQYIR